MTMSLYNGKNAMELANDADEAIRGINHLTRDDVSLRYPSEVYRTLGSLTSMTERLPQALGQIAILLERWLGAECIAIDGGVFDGDPIGAVTAASVYLDEAVPALNCLRCALVKAQSAVAYARFNRTE
jgi:hypothetical protein